MPKLSIIAASWLLALACVPLAFGSVFQYLSILAPVRAANRGHFEPEHRNPAEYRKFGHYLNSFTLTPSEFQL